MGRKPDPRGKDRPRSIVLCGSVAEIAQRLADAGTLSATISDLLRREYGLTGALDDAKAALVALTDQRKQMQADEEALIQRIDALEQEHLNRASTIRPTLEHRLQLAQERLREADEIASKHWSEAQRTQAQHRIISLNQLIAEIEAELQEVA